MSMQRRSLLRAVSLGTLGSLLLQPIRVPGSAPSSDRKLVWVVLRGGADGLALAPPVGDADYVRVRGELALGPAEVLPIGHGFALNAALPRCAQAFAAGELSLLPACATPHRARSHFDAQKVLVNGTADPTERSGWLNRALASLPGSAIALGHSIPLSLQGEIEVANYVSPLFGGAQERLLDRLSQLYQPQPLFSEQLDRAIAQREQAAESGRPARRNRFVEDCRIAARFLREGDLQIVTLDFDGWDSHANQAPMLARLLTELDAGLDTLRSQLGEQWRDTVVVVTSEFGRTVAANGTGGSDHGTGGLMMFAGGDLAGACITPGAVLGDWPGLSMLYEDRDVYPANDSFAWLGGLLTTHLNISRAEVESSIFPGVTP